MPKPTAQADPYFRVLGADLTVQSCLQYSGASLYLHKHSSGRNEAEPLAGADNVAALANSTNRSLQRRVPLTKQWLANVLHWKGHSVALIARKFRLSEVSVRLWSKGSETSGAIGAGGGNFQPVARKPHIARRSYYCATAARILPCHACKGGDCDDGFGKQSDNCPNRRGLGSHSNHASALADLPD